VDDIVFTNDILPAALRPANNTPAAIPPYFPRFPAKYTYKFTPSYPPRAVDPEMIRKQAVAERALVEESLARLVAEDVNVATPTGDDDGKGKREEIWWETWKEMGCDLDRAAGDVWEVGKVKRELTG
jgi:hypothetical protein